MVAKLTDRANVQALVDPPANTSFTSPAFRGVQEATTSLLEPIFLAKSIKNQAFLTVYYRILREELTPLLKNHLIPRVQAMIILGEAGTADFLPLYEAQIKDPNQTIWVKLWALEGMVNVIDGRGPANGPGPDPRRQDRRRFPRQGSRPSLAGSASGDGSAESPCGKASSPIDPRRPPWPTRP